MAHRIEITPHARRAIRKLPPNIIAAVIELIERLAEDPRPLGCKKLAGTDLYRIRFGDYRILYSIQDNRLTVTVIKVAHRRDAYR